MQPRLSQKRNAALTLFEVGVVIAAVMILSLVLLPQISRFGFGRPPRVSSVGCVNNLKQVGLAYKIWAGDNNDILPMGISVTNGGSLEMVATGNVAQTFLAMSNELSTPRILFCPSDASRHVANDFAGLGNASISYFASADMTNDANPQMILSGDSHFEIHGKPAKPGLNSFWTNDPVIWSPTTRHMKTGNLGLADGSVQTPSSPGLRNFLLQTGLATNRFAIP